MQNKNKVFLLCMAISLTLILYGYYRIFYNMPSNLSPIMNLLWVGSSLFVFSIATSIYSLIRGYYKYFIEISYDVEEIIYGVLDYLYSIFFTIFAFCYLVYTQFSQPFQIPASYHETLLVVTLIGYLFVAITMNQPLIDCLKLKYQEPENLPSLAVYLRIPFLLFYVYSFYCGLVFSTMGSSNSLLYGIMQVMSGFLGVTLFCFAIVVIYAFRRLSLTQKKEKLAI